MDECSLHPKVIGSNSQLISVHVGKAAGCSLGVQLLRHFGDRFFFEAERNPFSANANVAREYLPRSIAAVHGHFRPHCYDGMKNAFRLTFIRQPVQNIISIYYFFKSFDAPFAPIHERFLQEKPDLKTFATQREWRYLLSETFFGGYAMERFDFIGFHETRVDDLAILSDWLALPLSGDVRENVTTKFRDERRAQEEDPSLIAELQDILIEDVRFYDRLRDARDDRRPSPSAESVDAPALAAAGL